MKKIGIIGSGIVGKVLALGFIKYGHDVMIGTREPSKLDEWKNKVDAKVKTGSVEDAARFGETIVLCVKGSAAEAITKNVSSLLEGKTVIDTTNPIADAPPDNAVLRYFTDINESLMERLQKNAPKVNYVKAFNSVGNNCMVNPNFPGGKPSMFICGNNDNAKAEVKEILDLFGHETVDLGKAEAARPIESLCILWCIPGFINNQWTHAFKLLRM